MWVMGEPSSCDPRAVCMQYTKRLTEPSRGIAVDPIKIGWLGSALDGPGGGYDKIHRLAFDEAAEPGLLDRPVEFVLHAEHGLPHGSAKNATDGFRYLVDEGLHRGRRRVQLRQRDHRRPARQRAAGAAHQLVRNRTSPRRLLLPARQRRLRRRRRARGRVAEAPGPRPRRGAERDLTERRGVLPLLPPGVPPPRREHRRGRDGVPVARTNLAENLDNLRQVDADALVYMGYGMLAAKGLLRARARRARRGTRRAS